MKYEMGSIKDRLQHAWNAFTQRDPPANDPFFSSVTSYRPDRVKLSPANSKTIISAIYNRIAIDAAAIVINHVRTDPDGNFIEVIDSKFNECLNLQANIDQTGRSFRQDIVMTLLDEGCAAVVPVETSINPNISGSFDITNMRVGKIVEWFPKEVKINLYNEETGKKEDIILPKKVVAIIENPFYAIMNEPNSTLQRLNRKLSLLDYVDEQTSSGKLDLIIQLPYVVKTEKKKQQAELRRKDIETQLSGSKYGIAYTDGTERITQLNRPVENNLLTQIDSLTKQLYTQLSITESILDGTADEQTKLNYYNQTIEPIISSIVDPMKCVFLTKTARSQFQSIKYFRDPFSLVPAKELSDIADRFTRNEILSSNEFRSIIGRKPSDDPRANELRNKNINAGSEDEFGTTGDYPGEDYTYAD